MVCVSTVARRGDRHGDHRPVRPQGAQRPRTEASGAKEDKSVSELSDENPAGRYPYRLENDPDTPRNAGRDWSEGGTDNQALTLEPPHDTPVSTGRGEVEAAAAADAARRNSPAERDVTPGGSSGASRRARRGPVGTEPMDRRITIRLTRSERVAIEQRARVLRVKASAWARAAMLDALDARRDYLGALEQAATAAPDPSLADAVAQLRRVGVNLNQLLRRGAAVDVDLLDEVQGRVDDVRAVLGDRTAP